MSIESSHQVKVRSAGPTPVKAPGTAHRISPLLFFLPFLCIAGALPGKDGWASKAYMEWTEDEALQVLTDSPWSKTGFTAFRRPDRNPAASSSTPGGVDPGQHSNCCRTFGSGIETSAADPRNTKDTASNETPASQAPGSAESFRVVWFSSMHVRQSLYRLRLINGAPRDPAAEEQLAQAVDQIVIAVSGPSMRRFSGASLEVLRPSTRLQSKKNSARVAELSGFVSPETRPDRLALFVFRRSTGDRPVFDHTDKEVVFSTGEGPGSLTVAFQLSKMTADGILDY